MDNNQNIVLKDLFLTEESFLKAVNSVTGYMLEEINKKDILSAFHNDLVVMFADESTGLISPEHTFSERMVIAGKGDQNIGDYLYGLGREEGLKCRKENKFPDKYFPALVCILMSNTVETGNEKTGEVRMIPAAYATVRSMSGRSRIIMITHDGSESGKSYSVSIIDSDDPEVSDKGNDYFGAVLQSGFVSGYTSEND